MFNALACLAVPWNSSIVYSILCLVLGFQQMNKSSGLLTSIRDGLNANGSPRIYGNSTGFFWIYLDFTGFHWITLVLAGMLLKIQMK